MICGLDLQIMTDNELFDLFNDKKQTFILYGAIVQNINDENSYY